MEPAITGLVIVSGLILGSFFNVLIWRLPRDESIVWPGSHCPKCNRTIRAWENITVVSYIMLGGKCAGCSQKISLLYPVVELATAGGALLLWETFAASRSLDWQHNAFLIVASLALLVLIPITVIDLQHYIIPNEITYTLVPVGLAASFLAGDTTPLQALLGIIAGGGTLWGIGQIGKVLFRKGEAMGLGDVKLMAGMGAIFGPKIALFAIMFGSVYGTLVAILLVLTRRLNADHRIPFGPWLAAGVWTAVLAGDAIVSAYIGFMSSILATRP